MGSSPTGGTDSPGTATKAAPGDSSILSTPIENRLFRFEGVVRVPLCSPGWCGRWCWSRWLAWSVGVLSGVVQAPAWWVCTLLEWAPRRYPRDCADSTCDPGVVTLLSCATSPSLHTGAIPPGSDPEATSACFQEKPRTRRVCSAGSGVQTRSRRPGRVGQREAPDRMWYHRTRCPATVGLGREVSEVADTIHHIPRTRGNRFGWAGGVGSRTWVSPRQRGPALHNASRQGVLDG